MQTNELPRYDLSDNPTGCCPRFHDEGWDGQELHFNNKLFVKAKTRSVFHMPLNMGKTFSNTMEAIEAANALDENSLLVLSYDNSPWTAEHYFAVSKPVPGQEMVELSGDYLTKVFEGPYRNAPHWVEEMESYVKSQGKQLDKNYFFYTTCPKCAKEYGNNHVVAVAQVH